MLDHTVVERSQGDRRSVGLGRPCEVEDQDVGHLDGWLALVGDKVAAQQVGELTLEHRTDPVRLVPERDQLSGIHHVHRRFRRGHPHATRGECAVAPVLADRPIPSEWVLHVAGDACQPGVVGCGVRHEAGVHDQHAHPVSVPTLRVVGVEADLWPRDRFGVCLDLLRLDRGATVDADVVEVVETCSTLALLGQDPVELVADRQVRVVLVRLRQGQPGGAGECRPGVDRVSHPPLFETPHDAVQVRVAHDDLVSSVEELDAALRGSPSWPGRALLRGRT